MKGLVRAAESRLDQAAAAGRSPENPLEASSFGARLRERFVRITGISPALPGGAA